MRSDPQLAAEKFHPADAFFDRAAGAGRQCSGAALRAGGEPGRRLRREGEAEAPVLGARKIRLETSRRSGNIASLSA